MKAGKLLFAQLMDFIPWTSFARSVIRYGGNHRVRSFSCAEQYRAMAFAQLTYRESLRDIEACLNTQPNKLYAMGFHSPVRRSTLADANELRDWRIYAELAERLMAQARKLYASESIGMDLNAAAYALDSTTIQLCLSLFPWAHFRPADSAIKMHTLLDLRGSIPAFIRITTAMKDDISILDQIVCQPGAYYISSHCLPPPSAHFTKAAGRWSCSSSGSRNICASRPFSAPAKMQSRRKSGSPSRSICWLPSSKSDSIYPAHSTPCCRCSQLPYSRKYPFHRHFSRTTTQIHAQPIPTK